MTDDDTGEQKPLRDAHRIAAIAKLMEGGSVTEIAKELGLSRGHVSTLINDDVSKRILRQGEKELTSLVSASIKVVVEALESGKADMTNALKAAMAVLKNSGLLKETTNVNLSVKPYVIKRLDGSEVVLGAKSDDEE